MYNFSSYSVYNLQLNMVEFDLQIYNFRTNLNVDSTAQNGINLQSTFLAPPPPFKEDLRTLLVSHIEKGIKGCSNVQNLRSKAQFRIINELFSPKNIRKVSQQGIGVYSSSGTLYTP